MPEGAYPLALYKSGGSFEWDGRPTDSCVVFGEDDHLKAMDDGWQEAADYLAPKRHPLDHDGDGKKGGSLPRKAKALAK